LRQSLPLLLTALLLTITLAGAQQQQQGYATVTVNADPPECVTRVVVFSQSRNVPVQVSKAGEGVWVSEPVPRGDWLTIAYEQASGCMNYLLVNEATLEKYYGMGRAYLYANYNVTLTVKAVKQTTQPPQPPPKQEPQPNMLQQILQAILPAAPTIAVFAAIPTAGYVAYRVARTAMERYREREGERYMLRKAAAFFSEGSRNPIIRRGWLWMDIDPASEIAGGRDNNRKIAAYLKLARVLPTSRERMRDLERETVERFEKYAMPAVVWQRRYRPEVEDVGESLIRYAVELAIDDPEVEKAIERLEKAGIDPYTIPREFAGIDELIRRYRGVSMEELGFKYTGVDERRFEKCPHCGGRTLKDAKYCTSCGTQLLPGAKVEHAPKPTEEEKSATQQPGQEMSAGSVSMTPETPPSLAPPTQPRTTVTSPAQPQAPKPQPEPAFQRIEPETLQPLEPQPRARATHPPIQQPQTAKQATAKPQTVEGYIPYESVLRGEFEDKTVILLPIKRSALPTALVAKQARSVVNLEKVEEPPVDCVIAVTRTTYRSEYKNQVRPSPRHIYANRAVEWLSKGYGTVWIITEEMYNMNDIRKEFEKAGYKALKAVLDVEASRKRLEKIMHPKHAAKLAVAGALIPWLADELEASGWEGVKRRLIEMMGKDDGEEVYQTLKEATKEIPEYPNKPLAISLGVLDEEE
jgi:hypothetical protein